MKAILKILIVLIVLSGQALAEFDPLTITSLKLWLDGADNPTILTSLGPDVKAVNGGAVTRWKDKSGNSYHANQLTAGNMPSYNISAKNGKGGVVFDGASADFLDVSTVLGKPTSYTVVTVAMNTTNGTASTAQGLLGSMDSGANRAWGGIFHNVCCGSGAGSLEYFGPSTDAAQNYGRSTTVDTMPKNSEYFLITQKYTAGGTAPVTYLNGNSITQTNTAATVTGQTGTAQNFSVGRSGDYASAYWRGTVLEVMVFNAALTDIERINIEKYLTNKWALYTPSAPHMSNITVETTASGDQLKVPFALYATGYPVNGVALTNINCEIKVPDAAIAACSGSITEVGKGQYNYTFAAGDINAVGEGAIRFSSPFTNDSVVTYNVVTDPLSRTAEGAYAATTFGGYIEKIKNYVSNKMTKSGSTYTIYKNDESTVYQTGTTSGAGRDPS